MIWEDNLWRQKNPGSNPHAVIDLLGGHKKVELYFWASVSSTVIQENSPYLLETEVEWNTYRKNLTRQPPPGKLLRKESCQTVCSESQLLRVLVVPMQCSIIAPTTLAAMPPPQRTFPPHKEARTATPLLSSPAIFSFTVCSLLRNCLSHSVQLQPKGRNYMSCSLLCSQHPAQ